MRRTNRLSHSRKKLLRLTAQFFLANAILLCVIGFNNIRILFPLELPGLNAFGYAVTAFFIVVNHIAYSTLLCFLPWFLIIVPLTLLFPFEKIIKPTAILLAMTLLIGFAIDSYAFTAFHFHLNTTFIKMMLHPEASQIFQLSSHEKTRVITILLLLLCIEVSFLFFIKKYLTTRKSVTRTEKRTMLFIASTWIMTLLMIIFSLQKSHNELFSQTKIYPLYNRILSIALPFKNSYQTFETMLYGNFIQLPQTSAPLNYPKHPMQCKKINKPLNIIIIGIDSWRFDAMTKSITPHINRFSQHTSVFNNHFSGGNATKPGLFSLFYSLPVNYWNAMLQQKKGPVLFHALYQQGYDINIYPSAQIKIPEYNRTVFREIKKLRTETPGDYPAERDRDITKSMIEDLKKNHTSKKPFFDFIFYNAAHGWCQPQDFQKPFQPSLKNCDRLFLNNQTNALPLLNRYKNSLHFIDTQIAKLLAEIKKQNLLKNSIVIITGDHGQEFNDNHLNYWEHASNFTRFQVQTPLLIHWPGMKPRTVTQQTSHYDLAPTLLHDALHCENPASDYSLGSNLFLPHKSAYLLVGSYVNFGLIEPHRIVNLSPTGMLSVQNKKGKVLAHASPNLQHISSMLKNMREFYRESK